MKQYTAGKKIRCATIILTILTSIVVLSSTYLLSIIKHNENMSNEITNEVEQSWRDMTHSYLKKVQSDLEVEISTNKINPYDNDALQSWIIKNTDVLYMHTDIDNFGLFAIGYSYQKDSINLDIQLNDNNITDTTIKSKLRKGLDTIINNLSSKTNDELLSEIDELSKNIVIESNYSVPEETIKNTLVQCLIQKDNVIFSTNTTDNLSEYTKQSYSVKNDQNEDIWVESIIIPEGVLGFNNEPRYINGNENIGFKKLSIVISVKSSDVLDIYQGTLSEYNGMVGILLFVLTVIILSSIATLAISFKNMLKLNGMGGDMDAAEDNRDSSNNINI